MDSLYSKEESLFYKAEEEYDSTEEDEVTTTSDHKIRYRGTKETYDIFYELFSNISDYCKENAITMFNKPNASKLFIEFFLK
jgi:hypothetical protein